MSVLRVAYVDDEKDLCTLFLELFSSDQVKIETFTDPRLAIEALKKSPPDLLFVDYRLPGMTGDDVAIEVQLGIPTILVTGDMGLKPRFSFTQILGKPYSYDDVQAIFTKYMRPE